MKETYPINPVIELLNTQVDKKDESNVRLLLFTPLTKIENDKLQQKLTLYLQYPKNSAKRRELDEQFKSHHKFSLADIIALGDTKMETRQANGFIENVTVKMMNDVVKHSYKCFVNDDWKEPKNRLNLNYHDDGGCSWNCLMQKLKHPEYGVLFTIPIVDEFKFKINATDNLN
jgi:hypothetical protein